MVRGEYNVCGRAAAVRGRDIPQRAARRRRRRAGRALRPGCEEVPTCTKALKERGAHGRPNLRYK